MAVTGLAAFPSFRVEPVPPALVMVTAWPWFITYVCAVLLWFRTTGTGVRFSLRNPKPAAAGPPRVPVRFEGDRALRGEGWIEINEAGLRVVGWTTPPRTTFLLAATMVVAHVVSTVTWWQGNVTWLDVVLPICAALQLCRVRTMVEIPGDDLAGAAFLRGSVLLSRREAEPLRFVVRESRAAELSVRLREIGCEVTVPAAASRLVTPAFVAADLDATLAHLRATNDRLAAPPS